MSLLEISGLKKHFPIKTGVLRRTTGHVYAVDGISFTIEQGETLGLVGESGCGKSTAARCVLRLLEATSGTVTYDGVDVMQATRSQMQRLRRDMQIVFQDPYSSLNPRMRVRDIIVEPLRIHQIGTEEERKQRVMSLLETVGLSAEHGERYPHEFSGGQRQRVGVARALALNPHFIVCDEPVSALDVSIRAQMINLLDDLQDELGLTYLFIAHDLSVVKHISDRVAVMYLGKIVEIAGSDVLYDRPQHPYTEALLSAVPIPEPRTERSRRRIILEGDVPSPANPPSGCVFHPRCPRAQEICTTAMPPLESTGDAGEGHLVACYFATRYPDGEPGAPHRDSSGASAARDTSPDVLRGSASDAAGDAAPGAAPHVAAGDAPPDDASSAGGRDASSA
jgi:oligopeptide/dipeptide ABC transporter ATP-binding protein